ncbi:MAG: hypothetical protein ABR533_05920 [Desulfonatronovibrio sp.]
MIIIGFNILSDKNKKLTDNIPHSNEELFQTENSSPETLEEDKKILSPKIEVVSVTSGMVEYVSPDLKPGQIIPKGHVLMHLNNTTQKVLLQRALANAAQAQSRLEYLETVAMNAHEEWNKFQTRRYFDPDPLIHYEPYLIQARLELTEALAYADNARINLEKTIFRASSTLKVLSVNVSPGETVQPGTIMAVLTELEKNNSDSGQNKLNTDIPH